MSSFINTIKAFGKIIASQVITAYENLKVALGYATKVEKDGSEYLVIDGQEISLDDEETLSQKAESIAGMAYKVCLVIFLLICSTFIVNEFFFLILLVFEIGSVYFLLKYTYEAFFKITEERYN